jgi:predicted DNA-binding WGR domain protein
MEIQMCAKWCLLNASDGSRGQNGKKKVYEVILEGKKVRMIWGMAEKDSRQSKTVVFSNETAAKWFAQDKVREKIQDRGYELVYSV